MSDHPVKELRSLDDGRRPYAGAPSEVKSPPAPTDSPAKIARSYFDAMELAAKAKPTLNPGAGQTPRQFENEVRRYERKLALIRYKQSIYPMVLLYTEAMEASPELTSRNSMAAACILGIFYTDDWRHVTKLLAQLGSIFGHSTSNLNVSNKTETGSIGERLRRLTEKQLKKIAQRGATEVFDDAEAVPGATEAVRDDRESPGHDDGPEGASGAA